MTEQQQEFRMVLRGYDPAEVDRHREEWRVALDRARSEAADRTIEVARLQASHERLGDEVRAHKARIAELEEEARRTGSPSFENLGGRIGAMLSLAEEEATSLRQEADEDAQRLQAAAKHETDEIRLAAERYAAQIRSTAEGDAARLVEQARRQADAALDESHREAAARREEGEAVFESQRARASAAAAEFEATLGERRDRASAEFEALMAEHQRTLEEAQARSAALLAEAQQDRDKAREEAEGLRSRAQAEADELLATAREQADRVRRDSDRELAAMTAQRDAITAQLGNVRTMLATVGGGSMLGDSLMAVAMDAPLDPERDDADEPSQTGDAPESEGDLGSESTGSEPAVDSEQKISGPPADGAGGECGSASVEAAAATDQTAAKATKRNRA